MKSADECEGKIIPRDQSADTAAWFAELLFWRPSRLSDEEMQLHFYDCDGSWSTKTQQAMERFGVQHLDLNENWALCAPYWSCPACRREKNDIFRLSKRGVILAKLELHHDHLRDQIWPRVEELFGVDWRDTIPTSSISRLDQIRELTSRFETCLVCSECNSADGKVKNRFRSEIDERFTFTPAEIGQFVSARPAQDHDVDYEKARHIWHSEKENFFARIELIDHLLKRVLGGQLTRDKQGAAATRLFNSAFSLSSLLVKAFHEHARGTERELLLWNYRDEFLARSTRRDSVRLSRPGGNGETTAPPTDEEYATYVDPVSPKRWNALPADWTCPVCERGKREIIRKSKAGKWTGGVRCHYELALETDAQSIARRERLFPDFTNDIFVRSVTPIMLCSECAGIGTALGQKHQSIRDPYLSLADRRSCISLSRANSPHDINFDIASEHAIRNEPYGAASHAYNTFRARVSEFVGRFERGRRWGVSEDELITELADDVRIFHRIDDQAECLGLVKWILAQRAILDEPE